MMAIAYDLHNFHSPQTIKKLVCPVDEGIIVTEMAPIRIEMHHHKIKVIT